MLTWHKREYELYWYKEIDLQHDHNWLMTDFKEYEKSNLMNYIATANTQDSQLLYLHTAEAQITTIKCLFLIDESQVLHFFVHISVQ